jgi:hypothetical protein
VCRSWINWTKVSAIRWYQVRVCDAHAQTQDRFDRGVDRLDDAEVDRVIAVGGDHPV